MTKKDYYTYANIILGLRKEYQENEKLLKKLMELIHIECKDNITKELNLYLSYNSLGNIYLNIVKNQSIIKELYDEVYEALVNFIPLDEKEASLRLQQNGDKFEFIDDFWPRELSKFNPKVEITNYKEFNEIYEILKNTSLFNSPYVLERLNNYQVFSISGSGTILSSDMKMNGKRHVNVDYKAKSDLVSVERNCWHSFSAYDMYQLLNTEIPRDILPKQYLETLDYSVDNDSLFFDLPEYDVPNGEYQIVNNKRLIRSK